MNSPIVRRIVSLVVMAGAFAFLLMLSPQIAKPVFAAPGTLIDHFDTSQTSASPGTTWTALSDGAVAGGEREIEVNRLSGTGTMQGVSNSPLGAYSHNPDADVTATTLLTYDGTDNNQTLNPSGLSLNFSTDNAFFIAEEGSNFADNITITVYSGSSTTCSSQTVQTIALPYGRTPRVLIFPFSGFALGAGCSSLANFAAVGAITVLIDTSDIAGNDIVLHFIQTGVLDYGDLPTAYNGITLNANDGARHVVDTGGPHLGSLIDGETDGQPNANALGDDALTSDDEDGVVITPGVQWVTGAGGGSVRVTVAGGDGCLYGWIDWNNDGDFVDADENIILKQVVTTGTADYTFTVPGTVTFPNTFPSRFRLLPRTLPPPGNCTDALLTATNALSGSFPSGEVEDHIMGFNPTAVTLSSMNAIAETNSAMPIALVGLVGVVVIGAVVMVRRRK